MKCERLVPELRGMVIFRTLRGESARSALCQRQAGHDGPHRSDTGNGALGRYWRIREIAKRSA